MLQAELSAVIWDVDGTLVDTAELHFQAWLVLAGRIGKPFARADFAATFGLRNQDIIPGIFGTHLSSRDVAELGERKEESYRAAARQHGVILLPGARALLEGLQTAGFKQAIGSSAPRKNLELILQLTQSEQYFQAVVSVEDIQRGKPDPEVFLIAANKLAVSPNHCLVLEDAVAGVRAAKAAGMKCIAVRSGGQHSETALVQAGADRVVSNLEQVSIGSVRQLLSAS
ncbi:MAG TPA: HAD family phosphatase [Gemmataceae bacterium]|nr:HAD family phosphatase [Gemmataceae bacterium]